MVFLSILERMPDQREIDKANNFICVMCFTSELRNGEKKKVENATIIFQKLA